MGSDTGEPEDPVARNFGTVSVLAGVGVFLAIQSLHHQDITGIYAATLLVVYFTLVTLLLYGVHRNTRTASNEDIIGFRILSITMALLLATGIVDYGIMELSPGESLQRNLPAMGAAIGVAALIEVVIRYHSGPLPVR
jgi:hypothetical protein